jgi:hypothetical protein
MSAVNKALNLLNKTVKHADEVVESAGRGSSRASMIKNAVNTVKSNRSVSQVKNIANAGGEAAANAARREGIEAATKQVQARTAQKAMNQTTSRAGSAVQKSREIIEQKRVNQVIDGHNARSRQTAMDTIVNNVKDQNINRVPKGHETARNAVNQATENVRNARTQKANWLNNNDNQMPIVNRGNFDTNPQASPIIKNGPDKPRPSVFNQEPPKQNFKEAPRPKTLPEARPNPFENNQQNFKEVPRPETLPEARPNPFGNNQQQTQTRGNRGGGGNPQMGVPEDIDPVEYYKGVTKDFFVGGISDTYKGIQDGQGFFEALNNAHRNADGSFNYMRAAGTFMTASAGARIASGGGLYKDRYGNPNLIGVPFI